MYFRRGFGFIEIITGAVILAFVMVGLFATFVSARKYMNKSKSRIVAINYIRSFLSSFYNEVREDTWNDSSSNLYPGNHTLNISETGYSGNYSVSDNAWGREVTININYPVD